MKSEVESRVRKQAEHVFVAGQWQSVVKVDGRDEPNQNGENFRNKRFKRENNDFRFKKKG